MAAARRQLAEVGAAGLSLREVAREIGMVSSAVYRYVDSRDDLLTRLIVEAYDALGETAERASAAAVARHPGADLERWVSTAHAIRRWSIDHPHQYLLLFGSPVPGYVAPQDTVAPGTRATLALVRVVADAAGGGRLMPPSPPDIVLPAPLTGELVTLAGTVGSALASTAGSDASEELSAGPALSADAVLVFLTAWTQMFGLIGFEITNQTRNMVSEHEALFDATVRRLAHQLGLR